ncbi:B-cell differentiation antigen CD72-like [Ochotona curzoniae]|uniref:B-cell differentiation antigen CD72-like n=1 Tax=Ochotona curzoniae TaxID=130825 RepID=UPI001B349896|nr:B-cell differentiation antigen CD72-like [Ochotona curzoniae]
MAEVITYAELQFVKASPRKNISSSGQESDEDGEVTYENMQVPSAPEAPTGLALAPGPGNQAEVRVEQPAMSWSSTASPTAGQMLPRHGHACCSKYLLLGLLLTCLLLGVAAICLGVRYQQASQEFGQLSRLLETTNNSFQEQLHLGAVQLGQMEKDLLDSKEHRAQSQRALEEEQRAHQAVKEQLQINQAEKEKTKETLEREMVQKQAMQQKLRYLQDTLRSFFTCPLQDACCVVGWILIQRRCFHISLTKRDWQESQKYCKSLLSDLAIVRDTPWSSYSEHSSWKSLMSELSRETWVGLRFNKDWRWSDGTLYNDGLSHYSGDCAMLQNGWSWSLKSQACSTLLPCICEMASFRFIDRARSLQNPGNDRPRAVA